MQLSQLNSFLMLSKTLNFTRAAENLYISQSSLSAQISALEEEVDCRLCIRTTRSVSLTAAGKYLADKAQNILDEIDMLPSELQQAQKGEIGILHVAYGEGMLPFLAPAINRMKKTHPQIKIIPHKASGISMMLSKENNLIDAILLSAPCIEGMNWVTGIPIKQSGLSIVAPKDHRLADRTSVSIRELQNEKIILFPRQLVPRLYDHYISAFDAHKVTCTFVNAPDVEACHAMAAAGLGLSIVPDYYAEDHMYGVSVVPVDECRFGFDLTFVYPTQNKNPCLLYMKQAIMTD